MIRKNNTININAFTLIEILAVIVVLSIILVIAVPRIINVIENSKIEAFRISAENLLKGAKNNVANNSLNETQSKKIYTIFNGEFVGDSIPVSGNLPENGKIYVVSNQIAAIAVNKDNYCAIMQVGEEKVRVEKTTNCELNVPGIVTDSCFTYGTSFQNAYINNYDSSCPKDLIIPSSINGYNVIAIQAGSFSNKQITSVEIPSSVEFIEWNAFEGNQLESIILGENLKEIGYRAFANNNIKGIVFSNALTTIRSEAFMDNEIKSLTIPNSVNNIEWNAFKNNHISNLQFGNGITVISAYSFSNNNLEEIKIPSSVNMIYQGSFSNDYNVSNIYRNNIKKVTIPNGVTVEDLAISRSFFEFYDWANAKAGGTYTAPGISGPWTKQ